MKLFSLPMQLVAVLIFVFTLGGYVNTESVQAFYTFSLIFKELLGFFLPFIVFFFICSGILSFKENAAKVLAVLVGSILASNFCVAMVTFFTGKLALPIIANGIDTNSLVYNDTILPYFQISLPALIRSEYAMLLAVTIGIFLSFVSLDNVERGVIRGKGIVELILNKLFIPIIPLYVVGFLLKIKHEGVFVTLFQSYGKTFGLMLGMHLAYLFLMYLVASGFNLSRAISYIKVSSASYLTAFSTMSSTATIPVTINCAIQNTGNKNLASIATPIMANVHLLGDGITIPLLSLVSMSIFLGVTPDIFTYFGFVFYFCLTMLAASGVPGGGIIVMIPILKSILGFTPEMVSIITTLYLLQDGFGTAANVTGDGALMIIINNWLKKFKI